MASLKERIAQDRAESNGHALNVSYSATNADVDIEWVTPEKATAYLETMGPNRSISPDVIEKYGRDMIAGRWMLNTQGIGFDVSGKLIDGQHRLEAIIKTGQPIHTIVVRDLHPEAMRTVDDNRKRSLGDDLKIEGRERYTKVSSALLLIVRFERAMAKGVKVSTAQKLPISRIEARAELSRLDAEPSANLDVSVKTAGKLRLPTGVPESAGATAHYLAMRHYGQEFVDPVFHALITGENLHEGDPTLALRQRLLKNKGVKPKIESPIQAAAILKALRDEALGRTRVQFKMHDLPSATVRHLFA